MTGIRARGEEEKEKEEEEEEEEYPLPPVDRQHLARRMSYGSASAAAGARRLGEGCNRSVEAYLGRSLRAGDVELAALPR